MGTTLTGTTPQDTYDSLIKVTDNGPLSGTAKYLSDGLGNDSALALSTGNIGVGTTTAPEKLSVAGAIITTGAITGHGANRVSISQEAANGAFIQSYGANTSTVGAFTFRQASSDFSVTQIPLAITAAGNVGIGTSAPTSKLHISAPDALSSWDSALPLVNVTNLDQTNGQGFALLARGGSLDANCNIFEVQDYSANSKFVVKGLGNVGIGTVRQSLTFVVLQRNFV
jgi:hypothetical protein